MSGIVATATATATTTSAVTTATTVATTTSITSATAAATTGTVSAGGGGSAATLPNGLTQFTKATKLKKLVERVVAVKIFKLRRAFVVTILNNYVKENKICEDFLPCLEPGKKKVDNKKADKKVVKKAKDTSVSGSEEKRNSEPVVPAKGKKAPVKKSKPQPDDKSSSVSVDNPVCPVCTVIVPPPKAGTKCCQSDEVPTLYCYNFSSCYDEGQIFLSNHLKSSESDSDGTKKKIRTLDGTVDNQKSSAQSTERFPTCDDDDDEEKNGHHKAHPLSSRYDAKKALVAFLLHHFL